MAKRRKKLRRRLYTFEQLEARLVRAARDKNTVEPPSIQLYGNVSAIGLRRSILIRYKTPDMSVHLASLYRMSGGDTGYAVHGFGRAANKGLARRYYEQWKRYVVAFTPWDLQSRLLEKRAVFYRVHGGNAVEYGNSLQFSPFEDIPPGGSLAYGRWSLPKPKAWLAEPRWENFPKFRARALAFYRSLQRRLSVGLPAIVQLTHRRGTKFLIDDGLFLTVTVPPVGSQPSRMLCVQIRMHDNWSRDRLKISHDYGYAHSNVIALELGKPWRDLLEWKSTRTALVGIHEWVNGTLYIPGPSH